MSTSTDAIVASGRMARWYAERVLTDIRAETFARKPDGVNTNHPAWVIGHLALYPNHVLEMIGRGDLAAVREGYEELFGAASECRDDPDGVIYPPMEELTTAFFEGADRALGAVAETDDATLSAENPSERMREMAPTVGAMVNFLLTGHAMMHLGQLSAWRRVVGLGPCM